MQSLEFYYDAKRLFDEQNYAHAIALLKQSIEAKDHFKTREMLGQCYEQLGDSAKAIEEYRWRPRLNPRSNKTAHLLASILLDKGEQAEAREIIASLLARSPTYGPARDLLARLVDKRGNARR